MNDVTERKTEMVQDSELTDLLDEFRHRPKNTDEVVEKEEHDGNIVSAGSVELKPVEKIPEFLKKTEQDVPSVIPEQYITITDFDSLNEWVTALITNMESDYPSPIEVDINGTFQKIAMDGSHIWNFQNDYRIVNNIEFYIGVKEGELVASISNDGLINPVKVKRVD